MHFKKLNCYSISNFSGLDKPGKMVKRAVECGLTISRKTTSGKLAHFQVIGDAVTADPFPRTGIVSAIASF